MSSLLDRQKEFTGYLVNGYPQLRLAGLPLKSAVSVTGNATQENLVQPVTTGPKDQGSDGALQWRLDRLTGPHGLKGWAEAQGLPWNTLKTQAAFFLWELHRDYPALETDLRAGKKSIATLTANICRQYERPSRQEYVKKYRNARTGEMESLLDRRIAAALTVYDVMGGPAAEKSAIPPALDPVVNAPGSSIMGLLCWLASYFTFDPADISNSAVWAVVGFVLVFLIGGKSSPETTPETETLSPVPELSPMENEPMLDPTTLPKILGILEAVVPIVSALMRDIPQIKSDIESLKASVAQNSAPDQTTTDALARVQALVENLTANIQH